MNKVILMGRLTREPESTSTQSGVLVTRFTVAVNRRFKKEGQPEAYFINVVAFSHTAEFVQKYFAKGQAIILCGSLQTRTYEKDGENRWVTEVIADEVNFCGSKKSENSDGTVAYTPEEAADVLEELRNEFMPLDDDDSLPF